MLNRFMQAWDLRSIFRILAGTISPMKPRALLPLLALVLFALVNTCAQALLAAHHRAMPAESGLATMSDARIHVPLRKYDEKATIAEALHSLT